MTIVWTDEDTNEAIDQGWCICNGPENYLQIQRFQEDETFETDFDAQRFVWDRACKEDKLAAKALAIIYYHSPKEFDAIFLSTLYILPE